jgi:hypothetical protein
MLGQVIPLAFLPDARVEDGRKLSSPYYDTRDDRYSLHVQDTLKIHESHDSSRPTGGLGRQIDSDQLIMNGESDPTGIHDRGGAGGAQTGSITPYHDL